MTTKAEQKVFKFVHPVSGDVFTYEDKTHEYKLNGVELPGTTTPLKLVNPLSWDNTGKMIDMGTIFQMGAIKKVVNYILDNIKELYKKAEKDDDCWIEYSEIEKIVIESKKKPKEHFEGAGASGTEIHALIEERIKLAIQGDGYLTVSENEVKQVENFTKWAVDNKVKFLYSEEPIYSKEWMNCGTVDFICEIDGKILIGDIKTNGDKRRYEWDAKNNKYDFSKPQSNIEVKALWQTGCYGKMVTEPEARKLIDKFDGVVIVNIMKSGEFDEKLDVRYDYNTDSLIRAYNHVIGLYREFAKKI